MNTLLLLALLGTPHLTPVSVPQGQGAMAPNITVSKDSLLLSWLEPVTSTTSKYRLHISEYSGEALSAPFTVWQRAKVFANWADVPSVTASRDGSLLVHWAEKSGRATYAYDVRLARLQAQGLQGWKDLGTAHHDGTETEHGFVSVLPEGATGFRAVWLDGRETGKVRGATTLRTKVVGSESVHLLDERVCDCCGTAAVNTPEGPVVFYRDRSAEEIRDIAYVRQTEGGWSKPKLVHADNWKMTGCPVNGPTAAASGRSVVVAWYTGAEGGHVRLAFSSDAGASFDAPIEVAEGPAGILGRVQVELLEDGSAVVSWMVTSDGAAQILVRRVRRTRQLGPVVLVAQVDASRKSGFPRMARIADDLFFVWTAIHDGETSLQAGRMALETLTLADGMASNVASKRLVSEYEAVDLEGKPALLSHFKGPVLVNLWATWCRPCREEIPALSALADKYRSGGLRVVGISVDDDEKKVRALVDDLKIPYAVWLDARDLASQTFGADALPATFLLDSNKRVVWSRLGIIGANEPDLERAIEALLQ